MTHTEKAGWFVLGAGLLAATTALGFFWYTGPGAARREIARLSSAQVFEAFMEPALRLHASLPEDAALSPADGRAEELRRILAPADYSYITKNGDELLIECGGGFLHYGYRLVRRADGVRTLVLVVEDQADRVLVESLTASVASQKPELRRPE